MNENKLTIAIVGNSPSLLKHKWGEEIDNHDIVVRFNNFVLEGYETSLGNKTTDIILAIISILERNDTCYKNLNLLLNLSKEHRIIRDNPNISFNKAFDNKLSKKDVTLFNENMMSYINNEMNYNKCISAGLCGIKYFLDKYPTAIIDVYGITFFKDNKLHNYDNLVNTYHESDREEEIFNKYFKNKVNLHI